MSLHPFFTFILFFLLFLVAVFIYDVFIQKRHTIQHNYPIVGHIRYWFESIGPELRQYWVAHDKEEQPFNRSERSWVYATAKGMKNTIGFGTTELIYSTGYPIIKHSDFPFPEANVVHFEDDDSMVPCKKVVGEFHNRQKPYRPLSIVNISAMSFGSLGYKAISALNQGAKAARCFHNTGEGCASPYHLNGADLVWQIGTGYFGARNQDGTFSLQKCVDLVERTPEIKMIEIKLSQGAKPGKGGILPGHKVTEEIARIRGIEAGKTCYSPNGHSAFNTVDELITFVESIANATGVPVGIKSAVGDVSFWDALADRMRARGEGPDFITIDGGEGGTGAAPLTFADHVSLPFKIGFARVYTTFQKKGLEKDLVWIGSAKLGFPDRAVVAFALGCDMINVAREAMMSIGCIQAQRCHKGDCPAGIATHSKWLQGGFNVSDKSVRCERYIRGFRSELLLLSHACGYQHPSEFTGRDIEFSTGINEFTSLETLLGYQK